jgi:flagellar hook-associated protein 2
LNRKQSQFNAEVSAYGQLKSDLSGLQSAIGALKDADDFKVFKATPADDTFFTATADSQAIAGNHSITVGQLAQAQKLVSAAIADTDTTTLGTGTLSFSNGTDTFAVTIDGTNNTLDGIVNAVNSASDNFGMSATILNDGSGYRLVFSPNDTGTANAITVAVTDTGDLNDTDNSGLSRLSYVGGAQNLTQTQTAQNATLTVDGLAGITSASNTVTGVIQGVTLNLKAPGSTEVKVAVDADALTAKANDFVTAYNKLISDMDQLHMKGGTLEGRNTVLTVQSQIATVFNTTISLTGNDYSYLAQIGISIQKDGKLSLNSSEFQAAVTGNLNDVIGLLTDETQGFSQRLYTELGNLLQADGVLDAATDGLASSIADIDMRKDQMQARLDRVEIRLRNQFAALDGLLGSMRQTSAALLQQIGQ